MDVEKIQKVNNLALDLMRQGLADTREDAIAQAEKIFDGKIDDIYDNTKPKIEKKEIETAQNPIKNEKKDDNGLSNFEITNILKQNTEFIIKKFKELQSTISNMQNEIKELKNKFSSPTPTVKELVSNQVPKIKVPSKKSLEEEKNGHPRVGKWEEEDVSIEKFFYMGSK